ncbi:hypothetical protein GWK47_051033 [Chionoecetes opilio]|uniref:Uncharacterized protein n=1 Tax=Chionoecetes opilio TaxID=41210 RepID=A0A8J4YD76_CHIOP|nr:hypothetical protein GWK47_051033 [Chionoecetes opilio]
MASKIREEFRSGTPLVVHWDGKLVMDLTTKEHVDRLPIIISGIGAPNCSPSPSWAVAREREHGGSGGLGPGDMGSRGSGSRDVLRHHGIQHRPQKRGLCPHRTEMGKRPAAFRLSSHILELVVHAVFVRVLGCSSSPEHLLFKRFQTSWESIDREDFGTGIMVEEVATV